MLHCSSLLLLGSVSLVSACSDGGSVTVRSSFEDGVEVSCTKYFDCMSSYPGTPAEFAETYGADFSACVTQTSGQLAELVDATEASVAAGRITFDPANVSSCNAGFTAASCASIFDFTYDAPASCDTILVGTVALGGTCTRSAGELMFDVGDCAGEGTYCDSTNKCVTE